MLSDEFIKNEIKLFTDLGDRLGGEVSSCKKFIKESNHSQIEKEWMSGVMKSCNYGAFLIKLLLASIDEYKHLPEEQFGLYTGKIAIQPFLEIINSFEQILNKHTDGNDSLKSLLEDRINKKVEILNKQFTGTSGETKKFKDNLIKQLKMKIHEMAFVRDTLHKHEIIDATDRDILNFAWNIRNSMHNNFCAIRDIDFTYPDIKTRREYHWKFSKGEELSHPTGDLIGFYIIIEQIIFILLKVLQGEDTETE